MKEKDFRSARPVTWFGTGKSSPEKGTQPETAVKLCITPARSTVTWAQSRGRLHSVLRTCARTRQADGNLTIFCLLLV